MGQDDEEAVAANQEGRREQRAQPRCAMLMTGKLYQRGSLIDCVVSNVSTSGAKLLVEPGIKGRLPQPTSGALITLTINRFGDFPSNVVWSHDTAMGIHFLQPSAEVIALLRAFLEISRRPHGSDDT